MGVLHKRAAWPVARPSDQAHALYRAPLCVWKQAPPQGDKARLTWVREHTHADASSSLDASICCRIHAGFSGLAPWMI